MWTQRPQRNCINITLHIFLHVYLNLHVYQQITWRLALQAKGVQNGNIS